MHRCNECNRNFIREHDLQSHLKNSPRHARSIVPRHHCRACNKLFCDEQALKNHLRSSVHSATQFHCCDCNRDFVHEAALLQHLRDKVHKPKPRAAPGKNVVCDLCKKAFGGKKALKQHKASPSHKPVCAPIACIGSNECNKTFTSPSSMILHLESGRCVSGLTRHSINGLVVQHDTSHVITSQTAIQVLEAVPPSPSTPDESQPIILTPPSSSASASELSDSLSSLSGDLSSPRPAIPTPEDSLSTHSLRSPSPPSRSHGRQSWFLCPLCPPASNRFRTAQALQAHSSSPAHAPLLFHCPTSLLGAPGRARGAPKDFKTLSGLAMHVESGACRGGRRAFEESLHFVNERLKDLGFVQIGLLRG